MHAVILFKHTFNKLNTITSFYASFVKYFQLQLLFAVKTNSHIEYRNNVKNKVKDIYLLFDVFEEYEKLTFSNCGACNRKFRNKTFLGNISELSLPQEFPLTRSEI